MIKLKNYLMNKMKEQLIKRKYKWNRLNKLVCIYYNPRKYK